MRILVLASVAAVLALPAMASAQAGLTASGVTGAGGYDTGTGCPYGRQGAHARTVYDRASNERIEFVNNCQTRTMKAVNLDSGATWRVDAYPDGDLTGVDIDGVSWRYERHARLYRNLKTGQTCAKSDPRHICQSQPG